MHLATDALLAARDHLLAAPSDDGVVEFIVARPNVEERVLLDEARLDTEQGLVGDNWLARGNRHRDDGSADPEAQITVMNIRVTKLVAADADDRVPLAGDQIYVDLDLSQDNLPVGTRLEIGSAVLLVTPKPHLGCAKFVARFGEDAMRFVNGGEGRANRWRGMNTAVVQSGAFRVGDRVRVVRPSVGVPPQGDGVTEDVGRAHEPVDLGLGVDG
jgi:hypothetical protein